MKTLIALLALASTFPAAPGWTQTTPSPSETLFKNVRVFDGTRAALSAPTNVLVRGNKIASIGAPSQSASATTIEGGGRTLMPGLIDNHVHLFMTGSSQGEMMDAKATFEELEAKAAEEARQMLMRGFTGRAGHGWSGFRPQESYRQGRNPRAAHLSQWSDDFPNLRAW